MRLSWWCALICLMFFALFFRSIMNDIPIELFTLPAYQPDADQLVASLLRLPPLQV